MSHKELSNADFTKQEQAIKSPSPADNSNQMRNLANALPKIQVINCTVQITTVQWANSDRD